MRSPDLIGQSQMAPAPLSRLTLGITQPRAQGPFRLEFSELELKVQGPRLEFSGVELQAQGPSISQLRLRGALAHPMFQVLAATPSCSFPRKYRHFQTPLCYLFSSLTLYLGGDTAA